MIVCTNIDISVYEGISTCYMRLAVSKDVADEVAEVLFPYALTLSILEEDVFQQIIVFTTNESSDVIKSILSLRFSEVN